jgi:microcystin-dependent protein
VASTGEYANCEIVKLMKKVLTILAIGLLLPAAHLRAQLVPPLINYQGQVLSADGSPLATGDYELTFRIFDTVEGGTLIWGPQVLDGTAGVGHGPKIPVVQGYFNVMLGPVDSAARPLTAAFLGPTRFLEIKVGTNNPISPRQQILSAPYALNAANGVPTGTIMAYGGGTNTVPAGWLLCDGSTRNASDTTLSALFAVIGKTYGVGDGTALSFQLPDLQGRTVVGAGQGSGLSNRTLSSKLGTDTITQVPNHIHPVNLITSSSGNHNHTVATTGPNLGLTGPSADLANLRVTSIPTSTAGAHTHSVIGNTESNIGGVAAVDNLQPSLVLNYIIKL